jgi:plastocyanin
MLARLLAVGVLGFLIAVALPASASNQGVTFGSDLKYTPAEVHITAGETVTWTPAAGNDFELQGGLTHHPLDFTDASIPDQTSGSTPVTRTFAQPGTYSFFCRNHGVGGGAMKGSVIVDPAPTSGTTTTTQTSTTTSTSQTTTSPQPTVTTPVPGPTADDTAPKVTVTKLTLSGLRRHAAVIRLRVSEAARASATLTVRRATVARGAKTYTSAGTRALTLKLTTTGRRLLRRTPRVSGVLRLTVRDAAGNTTKLARAVRLRA